MILGDKVRRGNIQNVNLQSAYYDVIVVFNLLEHLREPMKIIKNLLKNYPMLLKRMVY